MSDYFLSVRELSVNISGVRILDNINFSIIAGEQWIILGMPGSGKTIFAETLAGRHFFQGTVLLKSDLLKNNVYLIDQQHRFKNLQNRSDFYYQQRYNSSGSEDTMTVAENLEYYRNNLTGPFEFDQLIDLFKIRHLFPEPLIQLSNGENKRLQIVKALCNAHDLLILDQAFSGLDVNNRKLLADILNKLSVAGGQMLLITTLRDIPDCFTEFLEMEKGSVKRIGKTRLLSDKLEDAVSFADIRSFPSAIEFNYPDFKYAVQMKQVNIQVADRFILKDICWEVEKGSCWSVTGANGAGKSTLLSLITGDHPQSYANEFYLFDKRRGTGESIWDIKQKTGFLSPELLLYFEPAATAFTTIASGLFDTIGLFRQLNETQVKLVNEWLDFLDCSQFAHRLLNSLSGGLQRLILLGRAMIKTPPLLVLDEPFQGLDPVQTNFMLLIIKQYHLQFKAAIILVSHYNNDFPSWVNHHIHLEKGQVISESDT
jgi:molybdate transport system ATP-binding protein